MVKEIEGVYQRELLDLRNDFVFKTFFSAKRNEKLLLDFLNSILDDTMESVVVINANLDLTHPNDKASILDVRVKTDKGEQINIEIQLEGHRAFTERMLMYWAKMYVSQEKMGQTYEELKRAIQIIILDFTLLPKKHFHSKFQLRDYVDGTVFSKHAEIHVLEMPKLNIMQLENAENLEKWLLFLQADKEKKEELSVESSMMKEAFEEIKRLSQDPETRLIANSREFFLKDQMQREADAREDERKKIVISLHEMNFDLEMIAQAVKITKEHVKRIIENNK